MNDLYGTPRRRAGGPRQRAPVVRNGVGWTGGGRGGLGSSNRVRHHACARWLDPTFGESAGILPALPSAPVPTLFRTGTPRGGIHLRGRRDLEAEWLD